MPLTRTRSGTARSGSGHPYRVDPDQRHPVVPVVGEPVELRVLVDRGRRLRCRVDARADGGRLDAALQPRRRRRARTPPATAAETATSPRRAAPGPTSTAARSGGPSSTRPTSPAGRCATGSAGARTGPAARPTWFEAVAGALAADRRRARASATRRRLVPDATEWLVTERGPVRVRFAHAPRRPASTSSASASASTTSTSAAARLDTVVFEQYKQQGAPDLPAVAVRHRRRRRRLGLPRPDVAGAAGSTSAPTDPDRLQVEVELSHVEPEPTRVVDVAIYDGTPAEVLDAHLDEIGRPALPPDWVFRPWMSGNEWNTPGAGARRGRAQHRARTSRSASS